jgi:hypothetical protein
MATEPQIPTRTPLIRSFEVPEGDLELQALSIMVQVLSEVPTDEERQRIVRYLKNRFAREAE